MPLWHALEPFPAQGDLRRGGESREDGEDGEDGEGGEVEKWRSGEVEGVVMTRQR